MNLRYFLLIPMVLLAGCAQVTATRGSSAVNPEFRGRVLTSLVVDADAENLAEREAIERGAVMTLQNSGMRAAIAAIDIVPPVRDVGETLHRRKIMNSGAQAVLEIRTRGHRIVETYTGNRYYPYGYRDRWHARHGFYDPFFAEPPLLLEEPQVQYQAAIYLLPSGDEIWQGDFTTHGPTGMTFEEVGAHFGRELVERLAKDGVITPVILQ